MLQRNIGERIELAAKVNELRGRCNQLEFVNNNKALAEAEMEAPLNALNEFGDYLVKRTMEEREALSETGLWVRPAVGNAVAHTIYADLCGQLAKIRQSYGL